MAAFAGRPCIADAGAAELRLPLQLRMLAPRPLPSCLTLTGALSKSVPEGHARLLHASVLAEESL